LARCRSRVGRGPPAAWIRPKLLGDMGTTPPDGGSVADVRQTPAVPIQTPMLPVPTSCRNEWLVSGGTLMRDTLTLSTAVEGRRIDGLPAERVSARSEKTEPRLFLLCCSLLFTPWGALTRSCSTFMVVRRHAVLPSGYKNRMDRDSATPGGEQWQTRRFATKFANWKRRRQSSPTRL